jgi:hypothetical protein
MHNLDELKNRLDKTINDFSVSERGIWKDIISALVDYQEEIFKDIAKPTPPSENKSIKLHSGITSLSKNDIGKNYNFISVSDDINDADFPNGSIVSGDNEKSDGDWFIIGTGYLNCHYDDLLKKCGREHRYIGKNYDGEFEYSLILKNNILHHEKILVELEKYYNIEDMSMYAPMLRRFVFIETRTPLQGKITEQNLQLEKNGLSSLKGGWRAIWNIECSDNPHLVKINNNYKYEKNSDFEYIIPIRYDEYKLQISSLYDNKRNKDYISISPYKGEEPKKFTQKVEFIEINNENNISDNDIITYITPQVTDNEISRIYSKSDVVKFLKNYEDFIKYSDIHTKPQKGLVICSYEKGFEYPTDTEFFDLTGRPKLYVQFQKENDYLFYDRIVYITHVLQKKFPEYIWKGGYIE